MKGKRSQMKKKVHVKVKQLTQKEYSSGEHKQEKQLTWKEK